MVRSARQAALPPGTRGAMRLADFIEENIEAIVGSAEAFAATLLPAAGHLDREALRDHLPLILKAVALDLRTPQTAAEELEKSEGRVPRIPGAPETAAQTHALLRARSGFSTERILAGAYTAPDHQVAMSIPLKQVHVAGNMLWAFFTPLYAGEENRQDPNLVRPIRNPSA